jgi:isoleucyl-tRNA synthetase
MYRIAEAFVRWIAPVLSFTADEMWQHLPGEHAGNVLFATWYDGLAPLEADAALSATDFDQLLALREQVAKVLEPMRANGQIGAALEAEISVSVNAALAGKWQPLADELRFFLIGGDVSVSAVEADEVFVLAQPTGKTKCVRCWHHRADIGADARHPELCARCASNVEGPGEDRRWF